MPNEASKKVKSQIERIHSLPAFPLLGNILKSFVTADAVGDLRSLISNLESEPSIAAKVIGVANSALLNTGGAPVTSIKDAVIRLGLVQLKGIVYSILVTNRFNTKGCPNFEVPRFWYDSMVLAHCAGYICDHIKNKHPVERNEIYCIGLMLNIGLLAFIHINPAEMNALLEQDNDKSLCERERDLYFGMDHYEAGSLLLERWSLPVNFYSTLKYFRDSTASDSTEDLDNFSPVEVLRYAKILVESDFQAKPSEISDSINLPNQDIAEIKRECDNDKAWILSFAAHF